MLKLIAGASALLNVLNAVPGLAAETKPSIVLVHGALADGSSWTGVIGKLEKDGYKVVAVANPLRSVKGDSAYVKQIVSGFGTPVVLVGHSYSGALISEAATKNSNIKALVYVSAFAPDIGESSLSLTGNFRAALFRRRSTSPSSSGTARRIFTSSR